MFVYLKLIIIFVMLNQMSNMTNLKKYPISIFSPKGLSAVSIGQPFNNAKSGLLIMEEWKHIKGYEGYYEISNLGRVRTISRTIKRRNKGNFILQSKILKQQYNNREYKTIRFCIDCIKTTLLVHRLIAIAFIPNPKNKPQINHKNCIKSDNRIENLEWVTNDENQHHSKISGIRKGIVVGERNGRAILTEKEVIYIRKNSKKRGDKLKLEKKFNVSRSCIYDICSRRKWTHI